MEQIWEVHLCYIVFSGAQVGQSKYFLEATADPLSVTL